MLKLLLYAGLTAVGVIAALINPIYGAVTCIEAYLFNPSVIVDDFGTRYQLVAALAFLLGWAIHWRSQEKLPSGGRQVLACLWCFAALGALSAVWAVHSSQQAIDSIWEVVKTLVVTSLLVAVVRSERAVRIVVAACVFGAFHAAFMHTFGIRWGYVYRGFAREVGVLPDGQTPVMVLFLPLALVMATMGTSLKERLLGWFALPFILNSIVSTYQRTGFVSIAVEALLLLVLLPKRIVFRLSPVLLIAGALFLYRLTPDDYWEHVATIQNPHEEASANSRFIVNAASLQMLMDYPMGVGYGNYGDVSPLYLPPELLTGGRRSAHNSYFSVACETGFIGFAFWISAFLGAIWLCRRIRKRMPKGAPSIIGVYAMGIEIGLYGWLAGGCFQADHEVDPAYWFAGLAVALTRLRLKQEAEEENSDDAQSVLAVEEAS
jgi:hypothetical protein